MRIKVVYRRNLRMSEPKVAAQVAHAVIGLGVTDKTSTIVVLPVSDKKFFEFLENEKCYVQEDYGYTEIEEGTKTSLAWIEQ